jgi:hypothetical protein
MPDELTQYISPSIAFRAPGGSRTRGWGRKIAVSTAVLLFASVGIGLFVFVRSLNPLDVGVVLILVISALLGSWAR